MQNTKMNQGIPVERDKPRKRPGRRQMTAEEKSAAAKARAEQKLKADNLKAEVFVQYQEGETTIDALVEAAKADFHKTKKRTRIIALKLYIKPEEQVAYYVINKKFEGKVTF